MKKIIAILLSTAMLVAMLAVMAVPAAAAGADIAVNAFNPDAMVPGVSAIFTQPYTVDGYQEHLAFEPVSGNTFKVVAKSSYDWNETAGDILSSALAIPEGGFVWCIQWIADNDYIGAAQSLAKNTQIGETFEVAGLDLAAGTYTTVTLTAVGGSSSDDTTTPSADYDTTGNIALGKDVTGEGFGIYTADLTDGKAANTVSFDNNWFAFCKLVIDENGGSNEGNSPDGVGSVVVDLGAVYDLASFKVNALYGQNIEESGINSPAKISAYVAETADGEYTYVGDLTADATEGTAWATLEAAAKGQFVKIEVTTDGLFAFINEIAVYEAEKTEDPSDVPSEDPSDDPSEDPSDAPSDVPSEPVEDVLGEENADASFTMDITVPDSYKAGEEVIVTVTVNNISASTGLQHVHGNLYFDTDVLGFSFELKENKELKKTFAGFGYTNEDGDQEWEDFTKLAIDADGNWYVAVDAATAGMENADGDIVYTNATKDGELVFNIKFVAKEDATGDTVVYIPHASVAGDYVDADTYETTPYVGNGSEATIKEYVDAPVVDPSTPDDETTTDPSVPTGDDSSDVTPPTGDASSMIFFAIIALVAIAGSAVVIKTRK